MKRIIAIIMLGSVMLHENASAGFTGALRAGACVLRSRIQHLTPLKKAVVSVAGMTTAGVSAAAVADAVQSCPHAIEFSSPTNSKLTTTNLGRCTWVQEGRIFPRGTVTFFFNDPQAYATLHRSSGDCSLGKHEVHVVRYGLPTEIGVEQQHLKYIEHKRFIAGIENNGMNASKFSVYSDSPIVVQLKRYGWLSRWWHKIPNVERGSLMGLLAVPVDQTKKENTDEK